MQNAKLAKREAEPGCRSGRASAGRIGAQIKYQGERKGRALPGLFPYLWIAAAKVKGSSLSWGSAPYPFTDDGKRVVRKKVRAPAGHKRAFVL